MKIATTCIVTDNTQKDFIKKRKFLSIFFSTLLASFFLSAAYAEEKVIAEISTCANLQNMSLTGDHILINDIDCAGFNFVPVGSLNTPFEGSLDGAGFKITNVSINAPSTTEVGLFAVLGAAQVLNLTIEDIEVIGGTNMVGTLAGSAWASNAIGTTIRNVHVTGRVESISAGLAGGLLGQMTGAADGTRSTIHNSSANVDVNFFNSSFGGVGGMVGYAYQIDISDSYATGTVNGGASTGGLIGFLYGSTLNHTYATGNVFDGFHTIGGLVGVVDFDSSIMDSYATGDVGGVFTAATIVGGLVGDLSSGGIYRSFAKGDVRANGPSVYTSAGGLVGISSFYGIITNGYASGDAIVYAGNAGGLIGENSGVVINTYSSGWVSAPGAPGGLIGGYNIGTVANSYWDTITSNQSNSVGGIGKTTTEMYQQSTYANWDFVSTWSISNGISYPWLTFETSLDESIEAVSMK